MHASKITTEFTNRPGRMAFLLMSGVLIACSPGTTGTSSGRAGSGLDPDAGVGGGGGPPPAARETCGNGLDDDRNGVVDDGCACAAGETQSCWPGDPSKRNAGLCGDGHQSCEASSAEFATWGPCIGYVEPVIEIEGNCADEDCDGTMPGCGGETCNEFEICDNGIDDDCNGLTDCEDDAAGCDCPGTPTGGGGSGGCPPGEDCFCEERCVPGTFRYCDEPVYCYWGRQQCAPDGRWGACTETTDIPDGCEDTPPIPLPFDLPSIYSPACCVRAGFCCQNFGYDRSLGIDENVGNCAAQTETVCTPR